MSKSPVFRYFNENIETAAWEANGFNGGGDLVTDAAGNHPA